MMLSTLSCHSKTVGSHNFGKHATPLPPLDEKALNVSLWSMYLSQGEAGPPSEKELVTNAVQQAVAPTGTIKRPFLES